MSTEPFTLARLAPSRRHALALGASLVTLPAGILALAAVPDPIFARVAEHKRRMEQVRACDTTRDGEDRLADLCDFADEAFVGLLQTVPTTLPGMLALVRYVGEANPDLELGMQETEDGQTFEDLFLTTLEAALARITTEVRA